MNFRTLIERAMHEAREEFAEIVARKLAAIMGDVDAPRRGRPPKVARTATSKGAPKPGKGRRAAPDHMANLQERVLHAMRPGEAMKKSVIMHAARLPAVEETRVRTILAKLKSEGVITMKGVRGSAVYTRK